MCGFAGIYASHRLRRGTLLDAVLPMTDTLVHRGPDDHDYWWDRDAGIALGFRRLSILDLSENGRQPMRSPSGRFTLVFNGEVYNEEPLRRELGGLGWRFRGHSDTEVVLAAFEAWGVRPALKRFVGMFAMAAWDARTRSLHLVRDRMGIKPLFVHGAPGLVTFASELKALLAAPLFDRSLDPAALLAYLRYLYVPAPASVFRNTVKLPPGHLLTVRDPSAPLPPSEPYWDLGEVAEQGARHPFRGSPEEAVDELERILVDAVAVRMRSDVPLGALLSGGVDSSTVVALMQRASSRPVRTYSIGFGGGEHDESAHAAAVARHVGTQHTELQVSGSDALDVLPCMPTYFDEPHADPSQIPTYLVSRLARTEVTVAMSGDGGDELFAGYNRYIHGLRLMKRLQGVPRPARTVMARSIGAVPAASWARAYHRLGGWLPGSGEQRLVGEKVAKLGALLDSDDAPGMYRSLVSAWQDPGHLLAEAVDDPGPRPRLTSLHPAGWLRDVGVFDQAWYLPDDLLAKVDRASMAVSLEVRVPILDHRVVEFSWTLPADLKIRDGQGKWILRQLLHRHVPAEIVDRPKVGFSVPLDDWLRGPLEEWAGDLLSPGGLQRDGIFEPAAVAEAWDAFHHGRSDLALGLWTLLSFQAWKRRWLA
jgi:asparagine synthase (glutamine-hydrolysing)